MEKKADLKKKMYDWLMDETPANGCMVCKVVYEDTDYKDEKWERTEYFLVQRKEIQDGCMFIINGRFWYDYDFLFCHDWEILYKHYEE